MVVEIGSKCLPVLQASTVFIRKYIPNVKIDTGWQIKSGIKVDD